MPRAGPYVIRGFSDLDLPPLAAAPVVAVVVPCYRVRSQVLETLAGIGPEVSYIFAVDDACPEGSGELIERECRDRRVKVLHHAENQGVGGAMITGFHAAMETDATVVVKLDGDGQMDPALIPAIVAPIAQGLSDCVKGNRFFNPEDVVEMPRKRLFGNAVLSFMTKLSSGYWSVMDPTNGFVAISLPVLRLLPLHKLSRRYFFESDLLFRLNTIRAVVHDLPMRARYRGERSSLRIRHVWLPFFIGHFKNTLRRVVYGYFLRGFSLASIELALSLPLILFGASYGLAHWIANLGTDAETPAGTVMLAALPIILGAQFLLAFLNHDIQAEPRLPLVRLLSRSSAAQDASPPIAASRPSYDLAD